MIIVLRSTGMTKRTDVRSEDTSRVVDSNAAFTTSSTLAFSSKKEGKARR